MCCVVWLMWEPFALIHLCFLSVVSLSLINGPAHLLWVFGFSPYAELWLT